MALRLSHPNTRLQLTLFPDQARKRIAAQDQDVRLCLTSGFRDELDQFFFFFIPTLVTDAKAPDCAQMPTQRLKRCISAHSSYQGASAAAKVTIANLRPSMQAVNIVASARLTTGMSNNSGYIAKVTDDHPYV